MEITQIQDAYIGLMQLFATFFVGNVLLLWMMFRGVSNAYIYGANNFGKTLHTIMSLCIVSFFAGTYSNLTSTVNNWAYALSESGEELNGALQLFVESTGATEYVNSSLIPSDPIGIVFILAILVGLIGGMWTSPAPKS